MFTKLLNKDENCGVLLEIEELVLYWVIRKVSLLRSFTELPGYLATHTGHVSLQLHPAVREPNASDRHKVTSQGLHVGGAEASPPIGLPLLKKRLCISHGEGSTLR